MATITQLFTLSLDALKFACADHPHLAHISTLISDMETAYRRKSREALDLSVPEDPPESNVQVDLEAPTQTPVSRPGVAVQRAYDTWRECIREPAGNKTNGKSRILDFYTHGLTWPAPKNYANGTDAWCGAFVAYCYAGAGLKQQFRKYWLPSCYRMIRGHGTRGHWAFGTERMIAPENALPGDIVIVGDPNNARVPQGSHLTLCVSNRNLDKGYLDTIEGNANGKFPDGSRGEGVIKQKRYLERGANGSAYTVMHVIRPLPEDYDL
jgi:hypothetical protein